MTALDILQKYWKYPAFRPGQEDIITAAVAGRDVLALLPTGGGKSICFQVPGMLHHGTTLVISPLIALMTDQVNQLKDRGIEAEAIHAGLPWKTAERILDNTASGAVKFLYVSPERLVSERFRDRLPYLQIKLLVVDEAHCISQWGYDFRPPYLRIAEARELLPGVTVMALTATATEAVAQDMKKLLQMRQPYVYRSTFLRSNMHLIVREEENKFQKLAEIMDAVKGPAMVYVRSRKGAREVAQFLQRRRIAAAYYHAGLSADNRSRIQQEWISGKLRAVACTNAFGMGIDKPDVRLVLHWDLPDSPEAYYQEAGRAGRDGNACYAGIIYQQQDLDRIRESVLGQYPDPEQVRQVYHAVAASVQLAAGAGPGASFPFDRDKITSFTGLLPLTVNNALQVLQQQGFLYLNEAARNVSVIRVLVDNETLYRYQVENRSIEPVIKALLRSCPGLFEEHVMVRESEIAHFTGKRTEDVVKALRFLQEQEVMDYQPSGDDPQVVFLTERYNAADLPLDTGLMKKIREQAALRLQAMMDYVKGKPGCRMQKILAYFGEASSKCGMCDHCVEADKHALSDQDILAVYDWSRTLLVSGPVTVQILMEQKPPLKKEKTLEAISYLVEHKWLRYNEADQLEWVNA